MIHLYNWDVAKEKMKEIRLQNNMSIEQLAVELGWGHSTVFNYESGRTAPNIEYITAFCQYFKIKIGELFDKTKMEKQQGGNEMILRQDKIRYIADHYGLAAQSNIAIEEMSELTKALCKIRRYPAMDKHVENYMDNVVEEIADVLIMAEQLRYLYGAAEVDRAINRKLDRQIEKIQAGDV